MAVSMPLRRELLLAALSMAAGPVMAQPQAASPTGEAQPQATAPVGVQVPASQLPAQTAPLGPRVNMETAVGLIVIELYPDKAPVTAANFLRYVKTRRYDGSIFYRVVRTPGVQDQGLVQGGISQSDPKRLLPPIAHESTTQTGLKHVDGTISMARNAPGTATADYFICAGASPSLDANPAVPGDNLGFAAFGRVVSGMDVVLKILSLPSNGHARNPMMQGQMLDPPVPIKTVRVAT